jgi:hypothetical protein
VQGDCDSFIVKQSIEVLSYLLTGCYIKNKD